MYPKVFRKITIIRRNIPPKKSTFVLSTSTAANTFAIFYVIFLFVDHDARIKGVVASETFLTLVAEDTYYLLVKAKRGVTAYDQLEFWINPQDSVVTFRSFDVNPTISDFGGNRKRIESIRKKAGVFGIMGEGLTADSFEGRSEINGPMAQLKAFYGLQSGEGFQEIFEE
jgi:uncharacterized protein (DUF1499 family)